MGNSIIFIFAAILLICLVAIFVFLVRLQTLLTATQSALAQSQQETATMRRALTATNVQGQWGEIQLRRIVELVHKDSNKGMIRTSLRATRGPF